LKETNLKEVNAFIVDHPDLEEDMELVQFRTEYIPREAYFRYKNKPVVIMYVPPEPVGEDEQIQGEFRNGKKVWEELPDGFAYMSSVREVKSEADMATLMEPRKYLDEFKKGHLSISPMQSGPYELGTRLEMRALKRQENKSGRMELASKLDSLIKWSFFLTIGATVFMIVIGTAID